MNALAGHDVGQGHACGEHLHAHLAMLRLGALFVNHPKCIGPAIVSDDDARVSHDLSVGSSLCCLTTARAYWA